MLAQIRQMILGGNICGKTQRGIKPINIEFRVMSLPIKQERMKVLCQVVIKNGKAMEMEWKRQSYYDLLLI